MTLDSFYWLPLMTVSCGTQIVIQIAGVRLFAKKGLFPSIAVGFFAGLGLLVILSFLENRITIGQHLADFEIYLCFTYIYFHWNNMGETARRIRLVIELFGHERGLTWEEIIERYDSREIINLRIGRLLASGQIKMSGNRIYAANPSVLFMAKAVTCLKWILLGPPS